MSVVSVKAAYAAWAYRSLEVSNITIYTIVYLCLNQPKMFKRKISIVLAIVFIDLLGFGMIIPLLALYAKHFGASTTQLAIFGCAYSLMQFVFSPFWGSLSDRFGRRPILLISLLGSSLAYLIFATANNFYWLLASRAFAGLFTANISTANAYITDITEPKDRIKYMGLVGASIGLGFTIGPAFGGVCAKYWGLSSPGFIASTVCALNFIAAYFYLEESLKTFNKTKSLSLMNMDLGAARRAFADKFLGILLITTFLATFAFSHMEQCFSLILQHSLQLDTVEAAFRGGMLLLIMGIVGVIIQGMLLQKITTAIGERKALLYGALLNCIALPLFSSSKSYTAFIISAIPIAIGSALINPCVSSLVSKQAAEDRRGEVFGVSQSLASLARVFGPFSGLSAFGLFPVLPFFLASGLYLLLYFNFKLGEKNECL